MTLSKLNRTACVCRIKWKTYRQLSLMIMQHLRRLSFTYWRHHTIRSRTRYKFLIGSYTTTKTIPQILSTSLRKYYRAELQRYRNLRHMYRVSTTNITNSKTPLYNSTVITVSMTSSDGKKGMTENTTKQGTETIDRSYKYRKTWSMIKIDAWVMWSM